MNRVLHPQIAPGEEAVPRQRLLSTAPAITELCGALGLLDQLVARTRYCDFPPAVLALPSIGALNDLNVEALLELRPDLVLYSGTSQAIAERLAQLQLRHESLPDATLEDLFRATARLGELTGRPRTAAALAGQLRAELEEIAAAARKAPAQRVLILTGTLGEPPAAPFVAGGGSFYDDLLRLAGHRNALEDSQRPFGLLSLEHIVRIDPDIIIELDPTGRARSGGDADALRVWGQVRPRLSAVDRGRVHVLTGPQHYLLGPRIVDTFAELCALLAPRVDAATGANDNAASRRGIQPGQDDSR